MELSIESKEERSAEKGDHKVREGWILAALVKHGRDFGPCPKTKKSHFKQWGDIIGSEF